MQLDRIEGKPDEKVAWGSDIAAQMLRRLGIPYVSLNPGASYRGLHDSLVNHLGNERPGILLVPARGSFGCDRAWLCQGDRRAHGLRAAQQCRAAARHDESVQRLVRPRAHDRARRDRPARCRKAPPLDRLDSHLARSRRLYPLDHQMGRPAVLAAGAGGIHVPRQYRHAHGADRAGLYLPRCRIAGIPARHASRNGRRSPASCRPSRRDPERPRSTRPRRCWRVPSGR